MERETCPPACQLGMNECALNCLARGQKARVTAVRGANRCRLVEMGLTTGTEVEVCRRAAFGGPMEIRLRSYRLSLRMEEAGEIQVALPDSAE